MSIVKIMPEIIMSESGAIKLARSWVCQVISSPILLGGSLCISFLIAVLVMSLSNFLFDICGTGIPFSQLKLHVGGKVYSQLNLKSCLSWINLIAAVCIREWFLVTLLVRHNPGKNLEKSSKRRKTKKHKNKKKRRTGQSFSIKKVIEDKLIYAQSCILQSVYPFACKFVDFVVAKYCPPQKQNSDENLTANFADVDYELDIGRSLPNFIESKSKSKKRSHNLDYELDIGRSLPNFIKPKSKSKKRSHNRQNINLDRVRKWTESNQLYPPLVDDGYDACSSSDTESGEENYDFHEIPKHKRDNWRDRYESPSHPLDLEPSTIRKWRDVPVREYGDIYGIQKPYPTPLPPTYNQYVQQQYPAKPDSAYDDVMSNLSRNTMSLINDGEHFNRPPPLQGSRSTTNPQLCERTPSTSTIRVGRIRAPSSSCQLGIATTHKPRRRRLNADREIIARENQTLGALKYHLRKR